ncbi:MAG: DUF6684 family protein [Halohasta sp.]
MSTLFTREAILDIVVNLVPLAIIAFFSILFLLFAPWGYDPFPIVLMTGLHLVPFVFLAIITYLTLRAIEGGDVHEG